MRRNLFIAVVTSLVLTAGGAAAGADRPALGPAVAQQGVITCC